VEGQEESSVISTSESNEESKRRRKEGVRKPVKEARKAVCENLSNEINPAVITVACIISSPDLPRPVSNRVRFGYEIIVCIVCWKKIMALGDEQTGKMGC